MWGRRPTGRSACDRTYAPLPWRVTIRCSSLRIRSAAFTVSRATPYRLPSSCCDGSRSPGANRCVRIAARSRLAICWDAGRGSSSATASQGSTSVAISLEYGLTSQARRFLHRCLAWPVRSAYGHFLASQVGRDSGTAMGPASRLPRRTRRPRHERPLATRRYCLRSPRQGAEAIKGLGSLAGEIGEELLSPRRSLSTRREAPVCRTRRRTCPGHGSVRAGILRAVAVSTVPKSTALYACPLRTVTLAILASESQALCTSVDLPRCFVRLSRPRRPLRGTTRSGREVAHASRSDPAEVRRDHQRLAGAYRGRHVPGWCSAAERGNPHPGIRGGASNGRAGVGVPTSTGMDREPPRSRPFRAR